MSEMKEIIRNIIIIVAKFFLHLFWIFPIKKNRIIFSCYKGSQYSCSPKYVYLALRKEYGNKFEYIWVLNKYNSDITLSKVKFVKFLSLKYFFYICTCGVYINNVFFEPYIPKRKNQLLINTWHGGGAYKGNSDKRKNSKTMLFKDKMRDSITDYYISSCEEFTKCWCAEFSFDEKKFLPIGLPRNDILINEINNQQKISEIKQKLNLSNSQKILLYAPTWRFMKREEAQQFCLDLNINILLEHLEKKFQEKFVFLFRGHHCMKDILVSNTDNSQIIDVTHYPDMQELLLITDVFLNDYSSSIWDFALTERPGFLYTPDLVEYEKTQHFLTPINTWQYEHANTFDELIKVIDKTDDIQSKNRIRLHLNNLKSFETGHASLDVCEIIAKHSEVK